MKKLLPVLMLLIGTGAGVGAGVYMRPEPEQMSEILDPDSTTADTAEKHPTVPSEPMDNTSIDGMQYIKLSNQFVVPIVQEERVSAMVVMTLSVEVPEGQGQIVYDLEPKIRDVFLRVLFDHATIGGFNGAFINNGNLDVVRNRLREAAHQTFGKDMLRDVLIFEIARQDY